MSPETQKPDLAALRISHEKRETARRAFSWKVILVPVLIILFLLAGYWIVTTRFASAIEVDIATASLTYPSQASAVLNASGYVVAQVKASVASKGTGRLVFLGVEEGDRVRKGEIIARLEDDDVVATLARARADLQLAEADLTDAQEWLERSRALQESGLMAQSELDAAEARYRRVQAQIRAAQASVRSAEVAVENTRIRAPFDGTVLTKNADVGEVVAPFAAAANSRAAVVTMADMTSLQVEADVSESNITRVSEGQPCEIVLDAYPDVRYQGVVHKIVPTADRAKATVLTKVRFLQRDERVLPEMSAKVTFLNRDVDRATLDEKPKLTVPSSAVVTRDWQPMILLVRDGVVQETPVLTGERVGKRLEITEGLSLGDQVVVTPTPDVGTGTKVKPKP